MMEQIVTQTSSHAWVYWVLLAVYAVTILSTIVVVISENRNPVKSLAWVTVLLVVPVLGLVLYILFGRSIKNKRFISRRNRRKLKRHEKAGAFIPSDHALSDASEQQIKLGQSLMGAPFYVGNDAKIFDNGHDKFEALLADISHARHFIHLQYYIFEDDKIGRRLADALIDKAREGVKIRIIYDHVGSFRVRRSFFKRMRQAGIEVYPFFKVAFPYLGTRINWRNHRKICVIDGRVGYIGGMNVADRYIDGGKFGHWRDIHLRVTGPILRSLNHAFSTDWNFMGRPVPEVDFQSWPKPPVTHRNLKMQLVTSGPTGTWSNISFIFLKAIGNARRRVYVQTPYFLPTDGLLRALQAAALSKIDVRVMIPRHPDSALLRHASASYIRECLQSGIKVYYYEPGMLHSKIIIVDDEFASVGSTNFDFRSFEHNFEGNLMVYSREFNADLTDIFMRDLEQSTRVLPYDWAHRPLADKAKDSFMRLFSPIL